MFLSCPSDHIRGVVELTPSGEPPAPGHPVTAPLKGREVIGVFLALDLGSEERVEKSVAAASVCSGHMGGRGGSSLESC